MADPDDNADFQAALGDSDEDPLHFELSGVEIEFDGGARSDPSAEFRYLGAGESLFGKELAEALTAQQEHPVELWGLNDETLYPGHTWMFRGRFYWSSAELGESLKKHIKVLRESYGERPPARQDEISEILEQLEAELNPDSDLIAGVTLPADYLQQLREEFDLSADEKRQRVDRLVEEDLLDDVTKRELEALLEPADPNSLETYDRLLADGHLEVPNYLTALIERFGLSLDGVLEHLEGLNSAGAIGSRDYELARAIVEEMLNPTPAAPEPVERESRQPSRHIPLEVQDRVWRRDEGRCRGCGSQEFLEFDHMVPFSRGGTNTVRNVQLLCQDCNRRKGNRLGGAG